MALPSLCDSVTLVGWNVGPFDCGCRHGEGYPGIGYQIHATTTAHEGHSLKESIKDERDLLTRSVPGGAQRNILCTWYTYEIENFESKYTYNSHPSKMILPFNNGLFSYVFLNVEMVE